jgi:hypothetical protein
MPAFPSAAVSLPPKRPRKLPDGVGLRRIQVLLGELRNVQAPLTNLGGLRCTLAVLLEIAIIAHVDGGWQQRLKDLQEDEECELIVVGLLRFLIVEKGQEFPVGSLRVQVAENLVIQIDPLSLARWLPTAIQLIQLVQLAGIQVGGADHG